MKAEDKIYSFKSEYYDLWHYKISDEPVNKDDCFTLVEFQDHINEPFEVYEKHLRAIAHEHRIAHITVKRPSQIFLEEDESERDIQLSKDYPQEIFKIFVGEYDDEMKKRIDEYIEGKGWAKYRREERALNPEREVPAPLPVFTFNCDVYNVEHTLGFYVSRAGLIRNCFTQEIASGIKLNEHFCGRLEDFEKVEQYMDKEYIQYVYGAAGWNHLLGYYKRNFIENFEYGKSILYLFEAIC